MTPRPLTEARIAQRRRRWRCTLNAFAAFGLLFAAPLLSFAWGPTGHRLANRWAIETLPAELRPFFEANRQFIIDHANDPETWIAKDAFEKKRHFIFLDKYGVFPYLNLPHSYKEATEEYFKVRINRDGILPWTIGDYSLRLTNAFEEQNWDQVKLLAAALGYYVADADSPMHTTQNFDGQLTRQKGLADRFEVRLIDRFSNFFIMAPQAAVKIEDPTEYAFQMVLESNTWVDHIIWEDREAVQGLPDYNEDYLNRFYSQIGSTAMKKMNDAAHDIGSFWLTAWENAGRPPLPK